FILDIDQVPSTTGGSQLMNRSLRRLMAYAAGSAMVMAAGPILTATAFAAERQSESDIGALAGINHLVVIYDENHSFDNLYGSFAGANGISRASATSKTQVTLAG